MKKLLTFCLLVANMFTISAQQKPTKEETVAFMKRTCELEIGQVVSGHTTFENSFNYDNFRTVYLIDGNVKKTNFTYSLIKWENYLGSGTYDIKEGEHTIINLQFSSKVYLTRDDGQPNEYLGYVDIYIPKSKVESFQKACIRLSELAKEENKDPFQN